MLFFKKKIVKLYWWRYDISTHGNFGDEITKMIIERVFKKSVEWSPPDQCQLIGAGSILQDMCSLVGENKPYVWGSGFIEQADIRVDPTKFKILGVRGKLTKSRLDGDSSKIFLGDTGLLASRAIKKSKKKHKIGIVPHYVDVDNPLVKELKDRFKNDLLIIDATERCEDVVAAISSCEYIISSSLHGLIVADSYKIPNLHFAISDGVRGEGYKFKDYYSAFKNREYQQITISDISKCSTTNNLIDYIEKKYSQPMDLTEIQQKMIKAFPY